MKVVHFIYRKIDASEESKLLLDLEKEHKIFFKNDAFISDLIKSHPNTRKIIEDIHEVSNTNEAHINRIANFGNEILGKKIHIRALSISG